MFELNNIECNFVSGGTISVLVPVSKESNEAFLVGIGLTLGLTGAFCGGSLSLLATGSGVALVAGACVGEAIGAFGIPLAFAAAIKGLTEAYRYVGLI